MELLLENLRFKVIHVTQKEPDTQFTFRKSSLRLGTKFFFHKLFSYIKQLTRAESIMNTRQKSVLTFSSKLTIKTAEKH